MYFLFLSLKKLELLKYIKTDIKNNKTNFRVFSIEKSSILIFKNVRHKQFLKQCFYNVYLNFIMFFKQDIYTK